MRKLSALLFIFLSLCLLIFCSNANKRDFDYKTIVENHESNLPILYINVEGKSSARSKIEYKKAYMKIVLNDEYADAEPYDAVMEIKARGNSTYNLPKKPYKIKLDKATDLFGMGKSKHWVLLAQYFDEALMRNKIAYDFSGEMGLPYCESTWVDVVFNGEYIGVYQLCEQVRIGETRVDITDWEEEAENISKAIAEKHGWSKDERKALEDQMQQDLVWLTTRKVSYNGTDYNIDEYYDLTDNTTNGGLLFEISEEFNEVSRFRSRKYYPIMIKYPEYANTNNELFQFAKNYINAIEDGIYATDGYTEYDDREMHYRRLGDIDSLAKSWLCAEIFFNPDALYKSRYMYLDNDGSLLKFGPIWDYDYSMGAITDWDTVRPYGSIINKLQQTVWYDELFKDPYFVTKVCDYYNEYRDDIIAIYEEGGLIDEYDEYLRESALKNTEMWQYSRGYTEDVAAIKEWFEKRVEWLDSHFESPEKLLSKVKKYRTSNDVSITLYDESGNMSPETIGYDEGCYALIDTELIAKNLEMRVYVNGIHVGNALRLANKKYAIHIDGVYLDEDAEHRNVITVRIYRSGSLNETNFTCIEKEAPLPWYVRATEKF